jgi:hypothetical protein
LKRSQPAEPPKDKLVPTWFYAIAAVVVLVPCFWQSRIQAGDLGSHIYNAWLADLIQQGRAPGLAIVSQSTNVLFDLLLTACFRAFGASAAQRIVVALAVLIFCTGAWAFVARASGERPLHLMPVIAMLAYGWVFRMGLFNFYLSLGICLWALWLAWDWKPRNVILCVPLLLLAWTGHLLPVVWTVAVIGYRWIAPRLDDKRRSWLPIAGLAGIGILGMGLQAAGIGHWFSEQLKVFIGVDQVYVYDEKYAAPVAGVVLLLIWLAAKLISVNGWRKLLHDPLFQVTALSAAAIAIVPTAIAGRTIHATYLANRMSLPVALCLCALLARVQARRIHLWAAGLLAALFFGFSYADERNLNSLEDQFDAAIAQAPPLSRVVTALHDSTLHVDPVVHMIDRACLGRCYSYANYEPGSQEFRVRATGPNAIVAPTYLASWQLQNGRYLITPRDLPVYEVALDPANHLVLNPLSAGPMHSLIEITALPAVF